jgi:amino acid transporter
MTTPDDPGYGQPPSDGLPPSWQTPAAGPPPGYSAPPPGYGAPPPAGYGAPAGYGGPAGYGPQMRNGLGVAALVIGIISVPFGFILVGGVFGLFAIILGFAGRSRVKRGEANNPGVALAGIITGLVAIIIAVLVVVIGVAIYNSDTGRKLRNCVHAANGDKVAQTQCDKDFGITPTPTSNN